MLEQQHSQARVVAQEPTKLEALRQKVFMDRYSLKDAAGQPLEFNPEQLWARVAWVSPPWNQRKSKRRSGKDVLQGTLELPVCAGRAYSRRCRVGPPGNILQLYAAWAGSA